MYICMFIYMLVALQSRLYTLICWYDEDHKRQYHQLYTIVSIANIIQSLDPIKDPQLWHSYAKQLYNVPHQSPLTQP